MINVKTTIRGIALELTAENLTALALKTKLPETGPGRSQEVLSQISTILLLYHKSLISDIPLLLSIYEKKTTRKFHKKD